MLLPKFTITRLLIITAVCGGLFAIAAAAVRGQMWAGAISLALLSILLVFAIHALVFSVASILGSVLSLIFPNRKPKAAESSPFATNRLPPQLVRPEDPVD